jgi:hypothetical protein
MGLFLLLAVSGTLYSGFSTMLQVGQRQAERVDAETKSADQVRYAKWF